MNLHLRFFLVSTVLFSCGSCDRSSGDNQEFGEISPKLSQNLDSFQGQEVLAHDLLEYFLEDFSIEIIVLVGIRQESVAFESVPPQISVHVYAGKGLEPEKWAVAARYDRFPRERTLSMSEEFSADTVPIEKLESVLHYLLSADAPSRQLPDDIFTAPLEPKYDVTLLFRVHGLDGGNRVQFRSRANCEDPSELPEDFVESIILVEQFSERFVPYLSVITQSPQKRMNPQSNKETQPTASKPSVKQKD